MQHTRAPVMDWDMPLQYGMEDLSHNVGAMDMKGRDIASGGGKV